jgi:flagellar biosynthesis protein FlhB
MSFTAAAAVVAIAGGALSRNLGSAMYPFLAHAGDMSVTSESAVELARILVMATLPILMAILLAAAVAGAAGNLVQTGLLFTPSKLKPELKKISPLQGFKRIFGIDGLMQFVKSLVKVCMLAVIAWWVLTPFMDELVNLALLEPVAILPLSADILRRLAMAIGGLLLVVSGADWFWQKQRFMTRMRMTKEELKEDFKQSEGDPHVKARLRQIRTDRARRRMMQAVPGATVVVMNPTHYAVALKYEQGEDEAPVCVAKGLDTLALKIRAIAEEAGVPVIEDPPLARALYAAVEVDEMIPPAHYEAVAKIIGFILNAGKKRAGAL